MNYVNAAAALFAILTGLGGAGLFLTAGRQKGRVTNLESDLADERARTASLRLELADEVRRREGAEGKVEHCLREQDSLRRELDALGKVITAEAHIVAVQDLVMEANGKLDTLVARVAS